MNPEAPGRGWRVIGTSVQGVSHRRAGQPCQDAHHWQEMGEGILVIAVADGAGSASCAEIGSALAAHAAVGAAVARLQTALPASEAGWHGLMREVFQAARLEVVVQAAEYEMSTLDLATTLLLAVATPGWLAAGQVGDGAVVARLADGNFRAVTRPCPQEYINETTFLTSPTFLDHIQIAAHAGPITGLALFTDGLQMLALKMPQGMPHAAFFSPLLRLVTMVSETELATTQLQGFLESRRVMERADDDLTLVLAVREPING